MPRERLFGNWNYTLLTVVSVKNERNTLVIRFNINYETSGLTFDIKEHSN